MTEEIQNVTIARTTTPRKNRDAEGRIIRSKEWVEARIKHLETKKSDLATRLTNIETEISERTEQLKTLS